MHAIAPHVNEHVNIVSWHTILTLIGELSTELHHCSKLLFYIKFGNIGLDELHFIVIYKILPTMILYSYKSHVCDGNP